MHIESWTLKYQPLYPLKLGLKWQPTTPYLGWLERIVEMEATEAKYRDLEPGELLIDISIVTTVEDIDAAIKYLQEFKESLRIPDCGCEDCCCGYPSE